MFIGEPQDAVSFTDETSLQNKERTTRRVWIHGQINKFAPMDWFLELRGLYPDVQGELKSKFIEEFEKLPRDVKMRVFSGMRGARIHIVDTFSYEAECKQILRRIYKCDDYEKMLQKEENTELTKSIIEAMEDTIAESILFDSPAQRIERNLQARRLGGFGFAFAFSEQQRSRRELSMDLKPFRKGKKRVYDTASKLASKSSAVFADAVEFSRQGFYGEYEARQQIARMLDFSHAFDAGDDKSIEWLEGQRNHFITDVVYQTVGHLKPLYGNIDSRLSPRTQAADIAAKVAERTYDEYGLEGVLDKFDFITFNGEKITEQNVKVRLEFWDRIVEREEKIQKLIKKL